MRLTTACYQIGGALGDDGSSLVVMRLAERPGSRVDITPLIPVFTHFA
ncbi:hypothetical protein SEN012174_28290 [Salmonella enterica subsp. enterica serovar Newport]|nr:hypothetical protein SEN012174_28290 [Salmonella enterica subsp. enterica serovar Newport]